MVLTGLEADRTYWLKVSSSDSSGNEAKAATPLRIRTLDAGVAVQTAEEFRTGKTTGKLYVSTDGLGELTLRGPGSGTYESAVIDTAQMVDWRRVVLDASRPFGTAVKVSVRTGFTPTPGDTWSDWTSGDLWSARAAGGGQAIGTSGRYLQYRIELTALGNSVPSVTAVGFTHSGQLPSEDAYSELGGEAK